MLRVPLTTRRRAQRATNVGQNQKFQVLNRGRKSVAVDLKDPAGVEFVLRLCDTADGLVEGFRPGVTEKLGLGPDVVLARNPKLVYGRMTGWGQGGPMAPAAGHDINYIALTGALHAIGPKEGKPSPPLNLVGDFGGGGMLMAFGMVCGILSAKASGAGQVIDAAMIDGASALLAPTWGSLGAGSWDDQHRGSNMLDGGAHMYGCYETKDGKYISIGSLEPQFYQLLLDLAELNDVEELAPKNQNGPRETGGRRDHGVVSPSWADQTKILDEVFLKKTRDEWCDIMEGTDVCFAPVLTMTEAKDHPHALARNAFIDINGVSQPAPAPRFSHTPGMAVAPPEVRSPSTSAFALRNALEAPRSGRSARRPRSF